jgi:hypothetical protein
MSTEDILDGEMRGAWFWLVTSSAYITHKSVVAAVASSRKRDRQLLNIARHYYILLSRKEIPHRRHPPPYQFGTPLSTISKKTPSLSSSQYCWLISCQNKNHRSHVLSRAILFSYFFICSLMVKNVPRFNVHCITLMIAYFIK